MASTSASDLAASLLDACVSGREFDPADATALAGEALSDDGVRAQFAARALFTELVEPLSDSFDPRLAREYASLFSHVLARALPDFTAASLAERYLEVSRVRAVEGDPKRVVILSRVTLGADVAVTSLVLNAAKRRFPASEIVFAGTAKALELFECDSRLTPFPIDYGRTATLAGRLTCFEPLRELCSEPDTIVLDPDSRLSQLGLLPLCDAARHFLFESRAYGGDSFDPLPALASRWLGETLGVADAEPYLHPKFNFDFGTTPVVTASFGVGENPAKRTGDLFEQAIAAHLASLPCQVFIDAGAPGSEEEARVRLAVEAAGEAGARIGIHTGPFASFAAMIAASGLYFGYDSAGQHVAAAMGVRLVTVFNGFPNERMLARWTPSGPGPITLLRTDRFHDVQDLLAAVKAAISL